MSDESPSFKSSLLGLSRFEWLQKIEQIVDEDGYVEQLGRRHNAIFYEDGATLLVTFETLQGIQALSHLGQPLGWDMVRDHGWSHLCLTSSGDTWFRDKAVYGYFDRLIDDGFFDEFDRVLFYGAGPCGYAAASYSVAAPGARVLAIQPQATLDARLTEWDDRFVDMRIEDFTSRYGYAPDMLDAADIAYILYDPREQLDAMHAALFTRQNVVKHRMRFMGAALQTDLLEMGTWGPTLVAAANGSLTDLRFAQLFRARRDHRPYLRNLLDTLELDKRTSLVKALCTNVVERIGGRRFQRTLKLSKKYRTVPVETAQDEKV